MKKKVNILGTTYAVRKISPGEDVYMSKMHFGGVCDGGTKTITIINLKELPDFADEPKEVIVAKEKEILRHEIVHAFLNESGLEWNSSPVEIAWAKNEEMVDWFALQFPKIYKAYIEMDCVGV